VLTTLIASFTTLLTLAGLAFCALSLWSARSFYRNVRRRRPITDYPPVTILKSLKGLDTGLYDALASHCRQDYPGALELILGLSDANDPAAAEILRLQEAFPEASIRLVHCPEVLGANGKVSNLIQLLRHARFDHIIISDGDIAVAPGYLRRILADFQTKGKKPVGMVTAPYRGEAEGTLGSRLEALGIATDFFPGVLSARLIERGLRFGLGSTLAVTREALSAAGGLVPLVDQLADDYQLGARIAAAGYRVVLSGEVVATAVPAYSFAEYWAHQLRWARTVRDSRRAGYLGLALTYAVPWALVNIAANGADGPSLALGAIVFGVRLVVALSIGVGLLGDRQTLRDLWLVPLRDCLGLALWFWSFADNTVEWRGEQFLLRRGVLERRARPAVQAPPARGL
jgi:ceramide glucosyltransferase